MSTVHAMTQTRPVGTHERLLFHAAWALGALIFLSVGSLAVRPADPQGPLSLLAHESALMMMLRVLALAAVTSAIATVLAGRVYPDIGAFAAGVGLTLVSLRGDNMTYLLISAGQSRNLCLLLAGEGLFWFATMASAMLVSAGVVRWLGGGDPGVHGGADGSPASSAVLSEMAAPAVPGVGELLFGQRAARQRSQWPTRLKHVAVAGGVALILIAVFSAGGGDRAIRHGQACFAVAAAFYVASGRAQAYFPMRSTLWSCCSVPVVCLIAYLFSWFRSFPSVLVGDLVTVPASGFLRILPVTYVAVGICAVLLAHWRLYHGHAAQQHG